MKLSAPAYTCSLAIVAVTLCSMLSACKSAPEFSAIRAAPAQVESTVSSVTSGTVRAEQQASLSFGAVGKINRLNVTAGDTVQRGYIVAELENDDLRTIHRNAILDHKRAVELLRSGVFSASEAESATRALEVALANLEKSLIRAPFDGLITQVNVEVGQLSQVTTPTQEPLIEIVDLRPRYVRAEVDEVDLPRVTPGLPARVKILAVSRQPFSGIVRKVVPFVRSIREQDRTSYIELDIPQDGAGRLPAGASADVEIVLETRHAQVVVPTRALIGRGADRALFVVQRDRARRRAVTTGIGNFDRTEITAGLSAGEIVLLPLADVELVDGLKVVGRVSAWP